MHICQVSNVEKSRIHSGQKGVIPSFRIRREYAPVNGMRISLGE